MTYIIVFILGVLTGSFLNICIYRIPAGRPVIRPSLCPACGHRLSTSDLVPVISYLFLRGKCRYCGRGIAARNVIVELVTGMMFLLIYIKTGPDARFISFAILESILIAVFFIDLDTGTIPNSLLVAGIPAVVPAALFREDAGPVEMLAGMIVGGGVVFIVAAATRGGIGGGDIKLMALTGLYLGWKSIIAVILISFISGAAASIILIIAKKIKLKDFIPFGPFISIAATIAIFWGNELSAWYLQVP